MLNNLSRQQLNWLIFFLGLILFVPFLGKVHLFDWDEINFAEAAREMILLEDYWRVHIDFKPFWEKPPFFIWMQAASMHLFGINEFAARFPNAIIGIITLLVLFNIGNQLKDKSFGVLWVLCYAGSLLPHFYFKSGIIDPTFNLFIFLGVHFVIKHLLNKGRTVSKNLFLAGIFTGLAVLTKGPVGYLIVFLTIAVYKVFMLLKRQTFGLSVVSFLIFSIIALLVSSLWFGVELINNGIWFFEEFIVYQIRLLRTGDAGHSGPFFYHWYILLIGCFPASIFALRWMIDSFRSTIKEPSDIQQYIWWMHLLFWVVLLLFSVVKTKIVHYSSMAYFPITFLAAIYLWDVLKGKVFWKKINNGFIIVMGTVLALLMSLLVSIGLFKEQLLPFIKDPFAVANLTAEVHWSFFEYFIPLLLIVVIAFSVFYFSKKKYSVGLILLFVGMLSVTQLFMLVFAPKIEGYSQNAAIEFFKSTQGEHCKVEVVGYRSYANLFYTQKQPLDSIEKTYYVTRIDRLNAMKKVESTKELYRKNGFIFFVKEAESTVK